MKLYLLIRDGHQYSIIEHTLKNNGDEPEAKVIRTFADDRFGSSVRLVKHCRENAENELETLIGTCTPVMLP